MIYLNNNREALPLTMRNLLAAAIAEESVLINSIIAKTFHVNLKVT